MIVEFMYYFLAAFCEILGCYSFWLVFKEQKNSFWLAVGLVSLICFAYILTRVQSEFAGRAYAVYGGIYIASSLLWLYFVEKQSINKYDIIGASICIFGACVIIFANLRNNY